MRIGYLVLPFIFFTAACGDSSDVPENKDRLSPELVFNPRSAAGTDSTAFGALPTMDFKDTLHDFGTLKEGEKASYDFEFTNNGKTPLVISNAIGSCGCTVPDYPGEPVEPGKTGAIKVQFNSAGRQGHQEKSVTITTNSNRGTHMLYITGEVK